MTNFTVTFVERFRKVITVPFNKVGEHRGRAATYVSEGLQAREPDTAGVQRSRGLHQGVLWGPSVTPWQGSRVQQHLT